MRITNEHDLPQPLYHRLAADDYDYVDDPTVYSATEIINSPRITILRRRHRDEIVRDAAQRFWLWMGTAIHKDLENATRGESLSVMSGSDDKAVAERRLFHRLGDGTTASGKADYLDGKVIDWKFTSVWSLRYDKPEWEAQVNILAYLARKNGLTADSGSIWALFRDWKRSESLRVHDYPEIAFQEIPMPMWGDDKTENYIRSSIGILERYKDVPDDRLPLCSPEQRWVRDDKWAVVKEGRKSAVRLFERREDADEYIAFSVSEKTRAKHDVEFRAGEDKRCNPDNCDVCEFCSYWREKNEA